MSRPRNALAPPDAGDPDGRPVVTAAPPLGAPVGTPPTIGVLGRDWRATVAPWGAVQQWDDLGTLDWFVAADDRWYVPSDEPTIRQSLVDGTPVVESRLRIPSGDAIHRVYAVADHGGLTIVEVENDSPMPIAVAFAGIPVLSQRPPTDMPLQGIDLPAGAVAFPVGHRSTLTIAFAHDQRSAVARSGQLPTGLSTAVQVSRGWLRAAEQASRLLVPDTTLAHCVVRERCQLMLDGPPDPSVAPVDFLLAIGDLVRMGSVADAWIPELADAVAALPGYRDDPMLAAAFDAAERVCTVAGERRAVKDLRRMRDKLVDGVATASLPSTVVGVRGLASLERFIATGTDLFPAGVPEVWWGQNFEVYGVPTGPASDVSFAVRWHGERPAVLWECTGDGVTLTSSGAAPGWSTDERTGETLWPAPAGAPAPSDASSSIVHGTSPDGLAGDLGGAQLPPDDGFSFN